MNAKMNDHRMKMENILNRAQLMEEEKEQATTEYDLKNRRGLASQTAKKAQQSKEKGKPPVSSGKGIFKSRA